VVGDVEVFAEYRHVVRDHVYDKCWELDLTWAEVEDLLTQGEVVGRPTSTSCGSNTSRWSGTTGRCTSSTSSTTNGAS